MRDDNAIDPQHQTARNALRTFGPIVLAIGIIFMIVGFVDFFSAFGSFGREPTKFWCFFVGMPLLFVGGVMTSYGYMGRIARYVSQETTPVATDTFKYAVGETKESVRDLAGAIGEGLGLRDAAGAHLRCHKCNHENDPDARFCSQCGAPMATAVPCPACGELNKPDAKFCDHCGRQVGQ
jgi:hypothetical protein